MEETLMNNTKHNAKNTPGKSYLTLDMGQFKDNFPHKPFLVQHQLHDHPLFTLDRLLKLAQTLPEKNVEYNAGNIDVNMDKQSSPRNGLSAEETIKRIEQNNSWMVLKNVEVDTEYKALLDQCLDEVQELSKLSILGMFKREAFIFLSSPHATTPFHVDPEHNFLLQIRGSKTVCQFDPKNSIVASEVDIERGLHGKIRNLTYKPEFDECGMLFDLTPGIGIHFPVAAPHWVKNGNDVSISFSITFRSSYSDCLEGARMINVRLRRWGLNPTPVGQSEFIDNFKYYLFRIVRAIQRKIFRQ